MKTSDAVKALNDRSFALFFSARFVSLLGTSIVTVGLPFAVLSVNPSPGAMAQVVGVRLTAMVVFLILGGAISDKLPRLGVLRVASILAFATQAVAASSVIAGTATVATLTVIEGLNGAISAFVLPAQTGFLPLIVARESIQGANALLAIAKNLTKILGPSVGGIIVAFVSPGWALAADSTSYLLAAVALAFLRVNGQGVAVRRGRSHLMHDIRFGWREFSSRPWVVAVVVAFTFMNAINVGAVSILGPLVASRSAGIGSIGWGAALGSQAIGSVGASVLLLARRPSRPLVAAMLGSALLGLPMIALGLGAVLPFVMSMFVVAGLGTGLFSITWESTLQERIPEDSLSRVASYDLLGSTLAMPLGALVFGVGVGSLDPATSLVTAGILYSLIALGCLSVRSVRSMRSSDTGVVAGEPPLV